MYRRDIDGLRALAIVPVVAYHAGISLFGGGFIGVDIFFVISGFLITRILKNDIENQQYSIVSFYERRIRRIIPAFTVMVLVVAVAAAIFMLPKDLEDFGKSAWASALFSSNISFWRESSDYFGGPSDLKPLLHTWSLSVEEQFYIFFPILLFLLARFRAWRWAPHFCFVALAVSLGLSIYGAVNAPLATFYLLPTRAWELLAGSILAFDVLRAPSRRIQAEIEALLGIALILVPAFTYGPDTIFPGAAAIPPVLGSALILHAGSGRFESIVGRVLSIEPLRFIGLISYSLYLWHWPVIVFFRYYFVEAPAGMTFAVIAISIVCAILSWHFVEKPFRHRDRGLTRPQLFQATAGVLVMFILAGAVLDATNGLPQRVPEHIRVLAEKKTHQGPWRDCGGAFSKRRSLADLCVLGKEGAKPDFAIVGDSHADAMAASVFEASATVGRAGYQITDTGYRPLLGFRKFGEQEKYAFLNDLTTKLLDSHSEIRDVILPLYWRQATLVDRYLDQNGKLRDGRLSVEEGLGALIKRYPDKRFLMVLSTANSPLFGGDAAAREEWYGRSFDPAVPMAEFESSRAAYQDVVSSLSNLPNVSVLDLSSKICDSQGCHGRIAGMLAFTDDNHLSYSAAQLFHADFAKFLQNKS